MATEAIPAPKTLGINFDIKSPHYFGSEGDTPQETFVADQPLEISRNEYASLKDIGQKIADYIGGYSLEGKSSVMGVDADIVTKCLKIDGYGNSTMKYGGLDVYQDPNQGFKVLEINPRVQAMGLQDYRQEVLGIENQPAILKDLLKWIDKRGYKDVLVLGSRKNPFWRGYERITDKLKAQGIESQFLDAQEFIKKNGEGYTPDLILKFCNNGLFLQGEFSDNLHEIVSKSKIPIVNPLHASFFGYRGFMTELTNELSELFPNQYLFDSRSTEAQLHEFSWIKLESAGFEYVVNYTDLRKWGRDALLLLINRDFSGFENSLRDKEGGDAHKLREAKNSIINTPEDQVVWLGQSKVEPRSVTLKIAGIDTSIKILHRVYWFQKDDGEVSISLEGFGCEDSQFQRSKGKINAGTGFAVPMLIK